MLHRSLYPAITLLALAVGGCSPTQTRGEASITHDSDDGIDNRMPVGYDDPLPTGQWVAQLQQRLETWSALPRAAGADTSVRELPVPRIAQKCANYCGAAAVEMVLASFNITKDQEAIAAKVVVPSAAKQKICHVRGVNDDQYYGSRLKAIRDYLNEVRGQQATSQYMAIRLAGQWPSEPRITPDSITPAESEKRLRQLTKQALAFKMPMIGLVTTMLPNNATRALLGWRRSSQHYVPLYGMTEDEQNVLYRDSSIVHPGGPVPMATMADLLQYRELGPKGPLLNGSGSGQDDLDLVL